MAVRVYQMKRKVIAIGTVLQSVWPVGRDESKINLVFKDGLRQLTLIACQNRMDAEIYQWKFPCVINWQTGFKLSIACDSIHTFNWVELSWVDCTHKSLHLVFKCLLCQMLLRLINIDEKKTSPKTASNLFDMSNTIGIHVWFKNIDQNVLVELNYRFAWISTLKKPLEC